MCALELSSGRPRYLPRVICNLGQKLKVESKCLVWPVAVFQMNMAVEYLSQLKLFQYIMSVQFHMVHILFLVYQAKI